MMRLIFFLLFNLTTVLFAQNSKCYDLDKILEVEPTPVYKKHLDASKDFKIKLLKDDATISKYKKSGKLTTVKTLGKGYRIQKLNYSQKVLVPKAKKVLAEIGKKFYEKANGSTLTFTSLTRTLEDQCKLRKVNSNAALGLSSHNYGNSFDVSYVRFNDRLENNSRLEKILEKLLSDLEKSGKIYYIKEKQQSCFHVTVRN